MAPTEQEERCAALICGYLNRTVGGQWRATTWLDEQHNSEASPDVLFASGADDIALEIKRLTDGGNFDEYDATTGSLYRRLAPDRIRNFSLEGPPTFKGRLDPSLVGQLRSEIAVAAREVRIGERAMVRTRRAATMKFLDSQDPALVWCSHAWDDDVRPASERVAGAFLLEDAHYPDHRFVTDDGRRAFHRALQGASGEARQRGCARVEWYEEWDLYRQEDLPLGEGGVWMTWGTADFPEAAAIESVKNALREARRKFDGKKWGMRSGAALHAGEVQSVVPMTHFERVLGRLELDDVRPLDLVYLVGSNRVREFDFTASQRPA